MRQVFVLIAVLLCTSSLAQKPDYPQDYFRNPLDIPILLAGNFGECRPGHFHSGLDIKTAGVENQKVHAAADGYISRIKMEKGGFGHGLYITHPNGYTTLYAHLNDFAPIIQMYLKKEQYEKKHWDVDIQLSPTMFPVKKGQLIAYSGNTGASTAPHLHFEIRNTKTEHPLNPQLFGIEVEDHVAPEVKEVAIYFLSLGNFYDAPKFFFPVEKSGQDYKLKRLNNRESVSPEPLLKGDTLFVWPSESLGIGLNVDDHMDGSSNTIAFYRGTLFFDDSIACQLTLDDIGYDETRYINAYADYQTKDKDQKWIQCFFRLKGNLLTRIYSKINGERGELKWNDDKAHRVRLQIADGRGNESNVVFYMAIRRDKASVSSEKNTKHLIEFAANKVNSYIDQSVRFYLGDHALYDDIYFTVEQKENRNGYSDKFTLGDPRIPIHTYSELKIKAGRDVAASLKEKIVIKYSDGKDEDGRAAVVADSGWYSAKVRNFGIYWLDVDTAAPVIKSLQKDNGNLSKAKQITFEVKDNMTSVKTFSGYLDGKWVCFEQHGDLFFYKFDEHCAKGKHKLVFKAADENGNEAVRELNFTR